MALQLWCQRSVIPSTLHSARSWRVLAGSLTSQGLPLLRGCPLLLPQPTAHRSGVQPARARFWGRSQDGSQEQATVAVPAPGPSPAAPQPKPLLGLTPAGCLAVAAVAGSSIWAWLTFRDSGGGFPMRDRPDADEDRFGQDPLDGQEYKMALARTRQAVSVHKAMIFQSQGNPARAMVELRRALQENAIVREPLLNNRYEQQQLHDLYQLHMRNTNLPAEFSLLLQLREMLDIDNATAEALEQEVLGAGGSFSI